MRAGKGLKAIVGDDMDRVGSLADWADATARKPSPRPFPGF